MLKYVLKNQYIKDNIIFMTGTVTSGFLGYLFHFFIARILSVSEYGEVQSISALVAMFGVFSLGFSYFTIKYSSLFATENNISANNEFISYLNAKIIKVSLAISTLLFVFSPLIRNLLHLRDIWGILAGIVAVFFGTIAVAFHESLRAWQKFLAISIVGVAGAGVKLFFGYGIAIFFGKASAVVFSLAISSFFGWLLSIYFWSKLKRDNQGKNEKKWDDYISRKKIWKNVRKIFIYSFFSALVLNVDIILVKNIASTDMAGYYAALSILGKIILLLNMSVAGVALPRACADGHRGERLRPKIFLVSLGLMFAIGAGISFIYFLFPQIIVTFLFGEKYRVVSANLWLFGLISLASSLLKFETDLAFARHDFRISYLLLLTAAIMAVGIFKFHNTLSQVAISVSISFLLGYFLAAILNFSNRNKKIIEPIL